MKKFILTLIAVIVMLNMPIFACDKHSKDDIVKKISRYEIKIPSALQKELKMEHPGVGSGLAFKEKDSSGNLWFYSITDRGMNNADTKLINGDSVIVFSHPHFSPFIATIKILANEAILDSVIKIDATGVPSEAHGEVAVNTNLERLAFDPKGIDSEAVDIDRDGNFWVSDEYLPSILKISREGKILERFDVTNGLPEIIKHRAVNRGIESLVITPSGKIVFMLESLLDVDNKTGKTADFIRMVEFDPVTKLSRMFAYSFDGAQYTSRAAVKIGDISAIDDNHFLLIEQGVGSNGNFQNRVFLVDILNATDISHFKDKDGKELEYSSFDRNLIKPIAKKELLDMRLYGWDHLKLEGIAYIDNKTLAITNDNDFGTDIKFSDSDRQNFKDYNINLEKKSFERDGHEIIAKVDLKDTGKKTELWIVEFNKAILDK